MPKLKTTEEFIADAIKVHGITYDYSNVSYSNSHTKVDIICSIHGVFSMKPCNHTTSKQGCAKCAGNIQLTTTEFIEKAVAVHGNKYSYDKVEYTTSHNTVTIECNVHGDFEQQAYVHLQGHGCHPCGSKEAGLKNQYNPDIWTYRGWDEAGRSSKNFTGYSMYILRCIGKDEEFFKIGKTFMPLNRRFSGPTALPYTWSSLHSITGDSLYISTLEEYLHRELRNFKYVPAKPFNGCKECYNADILDNYIKLIDKFK